MIFNIAVAAPSYPDSLKDALISLEQLTTEAAKAGAAIVCFPESFLPGYPGQGFVPERCSPEQLQAALQDVSRIARTAGIAVIIPMDWYEGDSFLNVAWVISSDGTPMGYQTKNQLDPSEDNIWEPGTDRRIFDIDGLRFGITICHEGFRYPESVRWAAREGAHIVFHPNLSGEKTGSFRPVEWGSKHSPYYEKAQMMRALENTIYFAPSNYTTPSQESASAIISPDGTCIAFQPYGQPGVTVAPIDTSLATGMLANRFKPESYSV